VEKFFQKVESVTKRVVFALNDIIAKTAGGGASH
jgi:hypothetical protein